MFGQKFFGHYYKGLYVAIDGIRCCGKSTQIKELEKKIRLNYPELELLVTKEPGGSEKGDQIRQVIVSKPSCEGAVLRPRTNILLFAASRAQTVEEIIAPALEKGTMVLSDRCVFSSDCYQAFGDGNGDYGWKFIHDLNLWAVDGIMPDLVIVPEISPELSHERQMKREGRDNIYDAKDLEYFRRVAEAYHEIGSRIKNNVRLIDGSLPPEQQTQIIWEMVKPMIEENNETRREGGRAGERESRSNCKLQIANCELRIEDYDC